MWAVSAIGGYIGRLFSALGGSLVSMLGQLWSVISYMLRPITKHLTWTRVVFAFVLALFKAAYETLKYMIVELIHSVDRMAEIMGGAGQYAWSARFADHVNDGAGLVAEKLAQLNYIFPLDVWASTLIILMLLRGVCIIYRFVKSLLPTLS